MSKMRIPIFFQEENEEEIAENGVDGNNGLVNGGGPENGDTAQNGEADEDVELLDTGTRCSYRRFFPMWRIRARILNGPSDPGSQKK